MVLLLVFGVVVGPHVLDLAQTDSAILLISNVGLGFLFFVAGYELDLSVLRGAEGAAAGVAWALSIAVSLAVVGALATTAFVHAFLPVAIALTTTALGHAAADPPRRRRDRRDPRSRDARERRRGRVRPDRRDLRVPQRPRSLAVAGAAPRLRADRPAAVARTGRLKDRRVAELVQRGAESSSQTPVRITMLLLVSLLVLAGELGLDVVLGAFAAGVVLRVTLPRGDERPRAQDRRPRVRLLHPRVLRGLRDAGGRRFDPAQPRAPRGLLLPSARGAGALRLPRLPLAPTGPRAAPARALRRHRIAADRRDHRDRPVQRE